MKKILVVNVNWLGDVVFSTPALRALRKANEQAHIACLVISRCKEVLKNNPHLDEIIIYDENGKHRSLPAKLRFIRYLRSRKFDQVYTLHQSLKRAMIGFLAGIPSRIGYDTKGRGFLLTKAIPAPDFPMHKVDYFLNMLEASGIKNDGRECEFFISEEDENNAESILRKNGLEEGKPYVVLNPGGNWIMKRWPAEYFSQLGGLLLENTPMKVVIAGAKKDKKLADKIASGMEHEPVVITGATTLHELSAIMRKAVCVVSADSGPMHIAVSSGANTIAVFGPTSPELTGPIAKAKIIILKKDVGCEVPCYRPDCRDNRCMQEVSAQEVYEQILKIYREVKKR